MLNVTPYFENSGCDNKHYKLTKIVLLTRKYVWGVANRRKF